jgi:hypothetical protein
MEQIQDTTQMQQEVQKQTQGRGEVGTGTVGRNLKRAWKLTEKAFHKASLKRFARDLVKNGDENAKKWLDSKKGEFNQARSEKNATEAKLAGQASKNKKK